MLRYWEHIVGDVFHGLEITSGTPLAYELDANLKLIPESFGHSPAAIQRPLKFSVDEGFDAIGLDYGWGPSLDSKRDRSVVCEEIARHVKTITMSSPDLAAAKTSSQGFTLSSARITGKRWSSHICLLRVCRSYPHLGLAMMFILQILCHPILCH